MPSNISTTCAITEQKLSPCLGAVVSGIDITEELSSDQVDHIYTLLLQHKVIFFQKTNLDATTQIRFASYFGSIDGQPISPDKIFSPILRVHALKDKYEHAWHTDTSWSRTPPMGAVLRAVDVPKIGGDTIWADGVAAFAGLPNETKVLVKKLHAFHDHQAILVKKGIEYPTVLHPLVRTHPDTGQYALWPSYSVDMRIQGLAEGESRDLLSQLHFEITRPEYQIRYRWKNGDVAFWDNRCTLHYAVKDYGNYPRKMERVLVNRGEKPF